MSEEEPPTGLFVLNSDCVGDVLSFLSLPELIVAAKVSKTMNRLVQMRTKLTPADIYLLRRRFRSWKHSCKRPPLRRRTNSWARVRYDPDLRVIM